VAERLLVERGPQPLHDVRGVHAGYLRDGLIGFTFGPRLALGGAPFPRGLLRRLRSPLGRRSGSFGCHWLIGCYSVVLPGRGEAALLRFTSLMRCRTRWLGMVVAFGKKGGSVGSDCARRSCVCAAAGPGDSLRGLRRRWEPGRYLPSPNGHYERSVSHGASQRGREKPLCSPPVSRQLPPRTSDASNGAPSG